MGSRPAPPSPRERTRSCRSSCVAYRIATSSSRRLSRPTRTCATGGEMKQARSCCPPASESGRLRSGRSPRLASPPYVARGSHAPSSSAPEPNFAARAKNSARADLRIERHHARRSTCGRRCRRRAARASRGRSRSSPAGARARADGRPARAARAVSRWARTISSAASLPDWASRRSSGAWRAAGQTGLLRRARADARLRASRQPCRRACRLRALRPSRSARAPGRARDRPRLPDRTARQPGARNAGARRALSGARMSRTVPSCSSPYRPGVAHDHEGGDGQRARACPPGRGLVASRRRCPLPAALARVALGLQSPATLEQGCCNGEDQCGDEGGDEH